jgi:hypothetical protein
MSRARLTSGKSAPLPLNTIDETGHTYGDLTVLDYSHADPAQKAMWRCRCVCGAICIRAGRKLRAAACASCGCRKADPLYRSAVRMQMPARKRKAIARLAAAARWRSK